MILKQFELILLYNLILTSPVYNFLDTIISNMIAIRHATLSMSGEEVQIIIIRLIIIRLSTRFE